jgi:hypothetical protein
MCNNYRDIIIHCLWVVKVKNRQKISRLLHNAVSISGVKERLTEKIGNIKIGFHLPKIW